MKSVERQPTVDDLLQRWKLLNEQSKPATIDDLSADVKEDPAEVRERLQAIASMMSFLGMGAEAGSSEPADIRPSVRGALDTLSMGVGPVPRVLLRDTDGGPEPPLVRPNGGDDSSCGTRFRIDGEIARGGMGSVLKGRDPDLGRDVALKVLREDLRDKVDMVRRFVEEAQIGGQLQHPGDRADLRAGHLRRSPAVFQHEAGQRGHSGQAPRRPPESGREPAPVPLDLRVDRANDRLYARPRRDPSRPEAFKRNGGIVRRSAGDGLGPGESAASRRDRRRRGGRQDPQG